MKMKFESAANDCYEGEEGQTRADEDPATHPYPNQTHQSRYHLLKVKIPAPVTRIEPSTSNFDEEFAYVPTALLAAEVNERQAYILYECMDDKVSHLRLRWPYVYAC